MPNCTKHVRRGGVLVESMPFDRRVAGSNPALEATDRDLGQVLHLQLPVALGRVKLRHNVNCCDGSAWKANRNRKLQTSKAPLISQAQGTSLFTSAASSQMGCPSNSPWEARIAYCAGVSRRSATGSCELSTCPRWPYVATRAGFEPTTLRSKGLDSTNAPPRPTHSSCQ